MKISTKGRYALRLMIDLAVNNTGEFIPLKAIAAREGISDKYLEQIINILVHAGFVVSVRGANGGYKLTKKPEQYTAGEILRLTEGSLSPVACVDDAENQCMKRGKCATILLWRDIYNAVNNVVDNVTLKDMAEQQKNFDASNYFI